VGAVQTTRSRSPEARKFRATSSTCSTRDFDHVYTFEMAHDVLTRTSCMYPDNIAWRLRKEDDLPPGVADESRPHSSSDTLVDRRTSPWLHVNDVDV